MIGDAAIDYGHRDAPPAYIGGNVPKIIGIDGFDIIVLQYTQIDTIPTLVAATVIQLRQRRGFIEGCGFPFTLHRRAVAICRQG